MIKKVVLILVLSLLNLTFPVSADESENNYLLRYGGGGLMMEMLSMGTSELNELLVGNGFEPLEDKLITYGGNFFTQSNNSLRYTNFGAGGVISSTTADGKQVFLKLGHGGVWVDQILPLSKSFALSGGLATSLGGLTLEMIHGTVDNFTDGIESPQQTVINSTFFMVKPQVGVYYSIKRFMDLELKVGYHYAHTIGGWRQASKKVPGEQILTQMHGMTLLINLNFGF